MGENDWLYPEEARMLDEEFNMIETRIQKEQEIKKENTTTKKMATVRQINYLKQKLKNMGIDSENSTVMNSLLKEMGFEVKDINELTVSEMSKMIDSLNTLVPKIKEVLSPSGLATNKNIETNNDVQENYKQ